MSKFYNSCDWEYIATLEQILKHGIKKNDRTKVGTISSFAHEMRFDMANGFPILTTKSVHFKSVVAELLWFLKGHNHLTYLKEHGVKIWDEWAVPLKDIVNKEAYDTTGLNEDTLMIGNMYGVKWRRYVGQDGVVTDQIANLIHLLKTDPDSRRLLVNAWDASDLPKAGVSPHDNLKQGKPPLPPCHFAFQCYVEEGKLSMITEQRSVDMFLGCPFNITSYACLLAMLAQVTGLKPHKLIYRGGDCHIYLNHLEQVKTQVDRFKNGLSHPAPTLWLNPDITDIDMFTLEDIKLIDYVSEPALKAPVAV